MITYINKGKDKYRIDLSSPIDLSIAYADTINTVRAFGLPLLDVSKINTVQEGDSVNCYQIHFNLHGNGTHTECIGHMLKKPIDVYSQLNHFFFFAQLISVYPYVDDFGDALITKNQIAPHLSKNIEALVIRTMPNVEDKKRRDYTGTNPPYFEMEATRCMAMKGVEHLLVDLPSVDKEVDGGHLAAHRAFWQGKNGPRSKATITELIYVPDYVEDGIYLLNLQVAPFKFDAAPSRPLLYRMDLQ